MTRIRTCLTFNQYFFSQLKLPIKKQQATVKERKYRPQQVEFSPTPLKIPTKVRFFVMPKDPVFFKQPVVYFI